MARRPWREPSDDELLEPRRPPRPGNPEPPARPESPDPYSTTDLATEKPGTEAPGTIRVRVAQMGARGAARWSTQSLTPLVTWTGLRPGGIRDALVEVRLVIG